jgi:hypothetical protein
VSAIKKKKKKKKKKMCGRYIPSRPEAYEGDQHRKSRLPGLAMNKIAMARDGARRRGRLPCSPLVLLPGFVGQ